MKKLLLTIHVAIFAFALSIGAVAWQAQSYKLMSVAIFLIGLSMMIHGLRIAAKEKWLIIAVCCAMAPRCEAQDTNTAPPAVTNRVVSGMVTNTIIAIAGAPGTNGTVGVTAAAGQFVNAMYLYVAMNGHVGVGLGNTLKDVSHGALKPVTTESVDLPSIIPSNRVVYANLEVVTSQFYAPDKTHMGLGAGIYTLWYIGWLNKLHLGIFQNLQGIELGAAICPDIDQSVNLKFDRSTTVVMAKAGLRLTF